MTVDVGASRITRIAVPSHIGTLLSLKSNDGISETFFAFGTPTKKNGRVPPGSLKRLPPEYRDLPAAGEGVLRVGTDGEPMLFGADGESAEKALGHELIVDNEQVRIVKLTYQGETGLVREFKRGPKAGTIQATQPLSEAELSSVESEVSRVGAQGVSTSDMSTADIEIPTDFNDVVERYEILGEDLNECDVGGIEELEGYTHKFAGATFELSALADVLSKYTLVQAISYLVASAIAAPFSAGSTLVAAAVSIGSFFAGAIATALLTLATGKNYTVGIRDNDLDYYFGKAPLIAGGVTNQYGSDATDLVYAANLPIHLDPDFMLENYPIF